MAYYFIYMKKYLKNKFKFSGKTRIDLFNVFKVIINKSYSKFLITRINISLYLIEKSNKNG